MCLRKNAVCEYRVLMGSEGHKVINPLGAWLPSPTGMMHGTRGNVFVTPQKVLTPIDLGDGGNTFPPKSVPAFQCVFKRKGAEHSPVSCRARSDHYVTAFNCLKQRHNSFAKAVLNFERLKRLDSILDACCVPTDEDPTILEQQGPGDAQEFTDAERHEWLGAIIDQDPSQFERKMAVAEEKFKILLERAKGIRTAATGGSDAQSRTRRRHLLTQLAKPLESAKNVILSMMGSEERERFDQACLKINQAESGKRLTAELTTAGTALDLYSGETFAGSFCWQFPYGDCLPWQKRFVQPDFEACCKYLCLREELEYGRRGECPFTPFSDRWPSESAYQRYHNYTAPAIPRYNDHELIAVLYYLRHHIQIVNSLSQYISRPQFCNEMMSFLRIQPRDFLAVHQIKKEGMSLAAVQRHGDVSSVVKSACRTMTNATACVLSSPGSRPLNARKMRSDRLWWGSHHLFVTPNTYEGTAALLHLAARGDPGMTIRSECPALPQFDAMKRISVHNPSAHAQFWEVTNRLFIEIFLGWTPCGKTFKPIKSRGVLGVVRLKQITNFRSLVSAFQIIIRTDVIYVFL